MRFCERRRVERGDPERIKNLRGRGKGRTRPGGHDDVLNSKSTNNNSKQVTHTRGGGRGRTLGEHLYSTRFTEHQAKSFKLLSSACSPHGFHTPGMASLDSIPLGSSIISKAPLPNPSPPPPHLGFVVTITVGSRQPFHGAKNASSQETRVFCGPCCEKLPTK